MFRGRRGLLTRGFHRIAEAIDYGIWLVYLGSPPPYAPVTDGILSKTDRNNQLQSEYLSGIAG